MNANETRATEGTSTQPERVSGDFPAGRSAKRNTRAGNRANGSGEDSEAIVVVHPEPDVRLGSIGIENPADLVRHGAEVANALAEVINKQVLYVVIGNGASRNKYVKVEGWLTLGAMLGVIPVEDYCNRMLTPEGTLHGFEAKVNLLRARDGGQVGGASAECTIDERNWAKRDSYSLRSMAITRATGKAFRLSFGWVMKLAGFEATPAEEMFETEGSTSQQKAVETTKKAAAGYVEAIFYKWFDESQTAQIGGATTLIAGNQDLLKKLWSPTVGSYVANGDQLDALKYEFEKRHVEFRPAK